MRHAAVGPRPTRYRRWLVAFVTVALVLGIVSVLDAHDMFAKPERFFVGVKDPVTIYVVNGTFTKSENSIARPRVRDISVVSPSGRTALDTSAWNATGDTSTFRITTNGEGTYVVGAATRPNIIAMSADTFNMYLNEDGIPDVLAARQRQRELDRPARERYSKHVKAMIQAGNTRTDTYATPLGYSAEIIPVQNPYTLRAGSVLRIRTLVDGKPVARQYVQYGGRTPNGARLTQRSVRTDSAGVASVSLASRGTWYIKFIHMARLSGDPDADYESKWATLTFQVQ